MPLFSLDIQKKLGGEYFTNRYILELADVTSGSAPAAAIIGAEQAVFLGSVQFVSYRISDTVPGTDVFVVVPLSVFGLRNIGAGTELPLFNCVRVDFQVSVGRPSRKYLRAGLVEGDITDFGVLTQAFIDYTNANYVAGVLAVSAFKDVDGQSIISGACINAVAMRQLRRGSKRKLQPIIPVS